MNLWKKKFKNLSKKKDRNKKNGDQIWKKKTMENEIEKKTKKMIPNKINSNKKNID
jgi:hypothetical protein